MPCQNCQHPEKKLCQEYGLPTPDAVLCWVTNKPLKVGELNQSHPNNKNITEKP